MNVNKYFPTVALSLLWVLLFTPPLLFAQTTPDSSISVFFSDGSFDPPSPSIPPSSGLIRCTSLQGSGAGGTYEQLFSMGESIAIVDVASSLSPYRCKVTYSDPTYTGSTAETGVFDDNPDNPPSLETFFFPRDTQAVINLINQSGTPVTSVSTNVVFLVDKRSPNPFGTTARPDLRTIKPVGPGNSGMGTFDLVGNERYRIEIQPGAGTFPPGEQGSPGSGVPAQGPATRSALRTPNGDYFFLPDSPATLDVPLNPNQSNPPTQKDITVIQADSFIQVTLFDSDGTSAVAAFVNIESTNESNQSLPFPIVVSGQAMSGNSLILPVVGGLSYTVSAGALVTQGQGVQKIQPNPVVVTPSSGQTTEVNLKLTDPNYILNITPSAQTTQGDSVSTSGFSSIACFAYNGRREFSFSQTFSNGIVTLPLLVASLNKAENWRVGCHGIESSMNDSRQFLGEKTYTTAKGQSADVTGVTMTQSGTAYAALSEDIDVDNSNELIFQDGKTTLDIPSNALGSSGTASVTIKTAFGWRSDIDSIPLTTWDISPSMNDTVISDPDDSSELCIPVDEDDLTLYDADINDVVLARYDEEEQRWIEVETTIVGSPGAYFACGSVDHYSIFGTIIDVLEELEESVPTNFKVKLRKKKAKKKKCVFTWDAPDSEVSDALSYVLRFSKVKKKSKCEALEDDDFSTTDVSGTTQAILTTRKACCGEVLVSDSTTSTDRVFKKARK
ncbi:MAG: hypothetical protein KDD64_02930 [Bdellovibrionales bacterium]|nr:hypothetical protein [Bdellovibrionales bacterium]